MALYFEYRITKVAFFQTVVFAILPTGLSTKMEYIGRCNGAMATEGCFLFS